MPFKSLGAVSSSPSIITMAVCEIFSVKEWCDIENRVRSRSLEMAPFDRSHTSSYSLSILTMMLSSILCHLRDIPDLYLVPPQGVTQSEFREDV